MANVMINGGIFTFAMIMPSIIPMRMEIINVTATAATAFHPLFTIIYAQIIFTNVMMAPTDKSIPPSRIGSIMPTAVIPSIDI